MKSKWTKWKRVKKKRIDYYGNIFQVEREYGESLSIKGSDSVDNRDLLNIAFNIARIPRASARQSNEYTGDKTFLWTNIKPWVAVGSHQSFSGWARSIGREAAEREREREPGKGEIFVHARYAFTKRGTLVARLGSSSSSSVSCVRQHHLNNFTPLFTTRA